MIERGSREDWLNALAWVVLWLVFFGAMWAWGHW